MNTIKNFNIFERTNYLQVLYHFVNSETINYILENDSLFMNGNDLYQKFPGKFSVSMTRKHDFRWKHIRLTFDKIKIANDFKIIPVHYFNSTRKIYGDDSTKDDFDHRDSTHPDFKYNSMSDISPFQDFDNQFEDRIISNKNYFPVDKYLLAIDIMPDFEDEDTDERYSKNYTLENEVAALRANFDVPVNVVTKFEMYKL